MLINKCISFPIHSLTDMILIHRYLGRFAVCYILGHFVCCIIMHADIIVQNVKRVFYPVSHIP